MLLQALVQAVGLALERALRVGQFPGVGAGGFQTVAQALLLLDQLPMTNLEITSDLLRFLELSGQRLARRERFAHRHLQRLDPLLRGAHLVRRDRGALADIPELLNLRLRLVDRLQLVAGIPQLLGQPFRAAHDRPDRPGRLVDRSEDHLQPQLARTHSSFPLRCRARSRHSINSVREKPSIAAGDQ